MGSMESILADLASDGWSARIVRPPEYSSRDAAGCLSCCETNLCGHYGGSWACPPGWNRKMDSLNEEYGSAVLIRKTFVCDPKDPEAVKRIGDALHTAVRMAVAEIRSLGIACMGFADGKCGYCGVCSYPEPCRFPEQLVPSISATGTDMSSYLGSIGEKFSFEDDRVTLYGIVLYRQAARNTGTLLF